MRVGHLKRTVVAIRTPKVREERWGLTVSSLAMRKEVGVIPTRGTYRASYLTNHSPG